MRRTQVAPREVDAFREATLFKRAKCLTPQTPAAAAAVDFWRARCAQDDAPLPTDTTVRVKAVNGLVLVVEPLPRPKA